MTPFKFTLISAAAVAVFSTRISAQATKGAHSPGSGNSLVTALWFSHKFARPEALSPARDADLKLTLIHTLRARPPRLTWGAVSDLFDKAIFEKLAGDGKGLPLETMQRMLQDTTPRTRADLFPAVRRHADLLTTQFDLIDEGHRKAAAELVAWIARKYEPGKRTSVIIICTGNSRRSMLGSAMGNVAAAYWKAS